MPSDHREIIFPDSSQREPLEKRLELKNLEECLYFPKYYEIETVRACNGNCITCTKEDWRDLGSKVMDQGLFQKMADEMALFNHHIERVCLSRNGEPLLDPHICDRVRLLKSSGIKEVCFSTNAQLLTEKMSENLMEAGLDMIMLSIDGTTAETFEKIRNNLSFETVKTNILNFLKIRDKSNKQTTARIRFIETEANMSESDQFLEFWQQHITTKDELYIMGMHSWGNQKITETARKIADYSLCACVSPYSTMVILVNGLVPLCGADYNCLEKLGDFRADSIQDIWTGDAYMKIRKLHLTGARNSINLCRGCDIWDRQYRGKYLA